MNSIKTKELSKIGYTDDKARSLALNILAKHYKHHSKTEQVALLVGIRDNPEAYAIDPVLGKIAEVFMGGALGRDFHTHQLLTQPAACKVYGGKGIEQAAKKQMEQAMSLPVAVQGALMPDAHRGYGLPIGGVLATTNAVIPFAVGVDIGCRMALTIIDESDSFFKSNSHRMKEALREHTHFGMEGGLEKVQEHEVLDSPVFDAIGFLKRLQGKAARQLGSSGSGNHFVEFGTVELYHAHPSGLEPKTYLALLSHSGSRGLGASIAQHYTQIAMETCKLPREVQQLAWLDLDTEAGQEYWMGMNLAGDYATACHDRIHANLLKALGLTPLTTIQNHHNFAWKEMMTDGKEVIVHRKGATPAHAGEWGVIPGSMTEAAYLVTGNGVSGSLHSAAHGAGRAMSRQRAKENMTVSGMKQLLGKQGVQLIGGSVEENPLAYKDIEQVMAAQKELVTVQGKFYPKIVRMNKD